MGLASRRLHREGDMACLNDPGKERVRGKDTGRKR